MAYNHLNYLLEVKHVQGMIRELYEESCGFGTYAWMWRKLRAENRFFRDYGTFLKYAGEPRVNERIAELQTKQTNTADSEQLELF